MVILNDSPLANKSCYMSRFGGCSSKLTKEHFISRNILEKTTSSTLHIKNASHFFGGKNVAEIGIDSFSAKVLCDNHNPSLSVLDSSAGLAFETIQALAEDVAAVSRQETVESFHLASGFDMERWMIKVFCGLVAARKIRGKAGKILQLDELPISLFDALIGTNELQSPMGLYMHSFAGQALETGLSFGTVQLTDGSDGVGGLMLSLGLLNFVLVTSPRYGKIFHEPNWYRRQTIAWNVRQRRAKITYLFTY